MSVDHIVPVVSVETGFQDWNDFVARLWCDKSNLQRICDTCHDRKTQVERISRLKIKYTAELDSMESTADIVVDRKTLIKQLNKYIAKKKTVGLEEIVERAKKFKERLNAK